MGSRILANINVISAATATGSWANVTDMSISSVTIGATGNVVLLMAQMQLDPAGDNCAEFRFTVNGSPTNSPIGTAFSDTTTNEEANSMTLLWAVTGLSGSSNSFALQWTQVQATSVADESRNRTFQILEIDDADCTLEVDQGTSGQTGDPGSWGNLFQATGVSIAGIESVIIMLGNVPYNSEADESTDFQFGVDDTGEGAVTTTFTDEANGVNHWSGMHILDGLSAATHTFELKWQARTGAGQTDSTRRKTFQVIELTTNAALQLDLISSSLDTAGSFADVDGLTDSFNVNGTDSLMLINANMVPAGDSGDATADYSIGVDGTNEGAELISFSDSASLAQRLSMQRLKTGLSAASHSFQLRWAAIAGGAATDTGRARTLQVIEFAALVSYKLDGITYDKDAVALGSVECYLYKDNGDNTVTWLDYQLSNSSTGVFSFTGIADNDPNYLIVFFKDDAPTVMDVTDHNLTPVVE